MPDESIVREDSVGYQDLKNITIGAGPIVVKSEPNSDAENSAVKIV